MRKAAALAALFVAGTSLVSGAALAQSSLPWTDANPLEGSRPRAEKPHATKRAEAPKPAPAAAESTAPGAPTDVPVPTADPRPEEAAKEPAAKEPAPAAPTEPPKPEASPKPDAPTPVPGQPNAVQPVPAEAKPIEDIPVPDPRPADAPAPEPSAPPPPAPVEGQGGAEPAKPEDAPNSTEKLKGREPEISPATAVVAAAAIEDAQGCERELKQRGVAFTVEPSISEGECGVLRPVAIERLSSGVKVGPKTQMLCRTALALDIWMSDAVVPAAQAEFPERKLTEFRQASTYVCRPRASESGISEHARGSAIDIGAFVFDKGADVGVAAQAPDSPEARFQAAVRTGACGPFKTVLGPGTDPDHATHFHLDIAARKNGATYCK